MTQTSAAAAVGRGDARAAAAAPDAGGVFSHRQILTIIAGLMVAMFLAALDQTVVATAIRTIADDLAGYDLQAWATTAFLITSTISTPLYGKLSDIYGRRPFYLFAIAVFVAGSVLCGLATSMYELAAFRAVQGIGAGGLMSLALAIIGDIVPPRQRSRYQGFFMAVFGTSSVLGPVIGGFFAGQGALLGIAGWRWIFFINVPLGILAFAAVFRVLHLPHQRQDHRIDWPGALGLITAIVPVLIVAEQGRLWGWTSPRALACYALAVLGLGLFWLAERAYGTEALLPLRLFRNRSFAIATAGSVVIGAAMFGGLLLLPQYLQIVHGSSATVAGLQMIPLVAGIALGAMSSGITISRTGRYKPFPLAGTVLMTTALLALSVIVGAQTSIWALIPCMVLLGVGLGFNFQPAVLAVQNAVAPGEMGVATSSVTFFRQMGATLGTAAFLSVLFSRLPAEIEKSVATAAATDPRVAQALAAGRLPAGGDLSDTSFIAQLPAYLALPFKTGFAEAIDLVFLLAAAVAVLGFCVFWFLPQLALSTQSGIQARQAAARQSAAADQTTGDPTADHPGEQVTQATGAAAPTSTPPPTGRPGDTVPGRRPGVLVAPASRRRRMGLGRVPSRRRHRRGRRLLTGVAVLGMLLGVLGVVQGSWNRADSEAAGGQAAATGEGNAGASVSDGPAPDPSDPVPATDPAPATGDGTVPSPGSGDTPLTQTLPGTTPPAPTTPPGTTTPPEPTASGQTSDSTATTTATTTATLAAPAPTTEAPVTAAAPTTAVPTTEAPVTAAATTAVPTTAVPTTAAPTTAAPTTAAPTTEVPTTAAPTTAAPTTAAPTTEVPTTAAPTTEVPTTAAPTTAAPTTEVPTTAAPTTEVPTTAVPTTEVPTTEVPTTEAPSTEAPTTATSTSAEITSAVPSP